MLEDVLLGIVTATYLHEFIQKAFDGGNNRVSSKRQTHCLRLSQAQDNVAPGFLRCLRGQ